MSDATANIAIRVTGDTSGASGPLNQLSSNWDRVGEQGFRAARSLTNGLSGLLSAEQNVYNAQQRVNVATISYDLAVRDSGAGSLQAQNAYIALQQAQEGVTLAQDQLNLRFVQFALTTGPQIYMAISRMIAASMGMTVANWQETASWYAKAAAILVTVGALTAGLAVFGGLLGGAAAAAQTPTTTTSAVPSGFGQPVVVTQTNTFISSSQTNQTDMADFANRSVAKAIAQRVRP